jgi:hypothetical protein
MFLPPVVLWQAGSPIDGIPRRDKAHDRIEAPFSERDRVRLGRQSRHEIGHVRLLDAVAVLMGIDPEVRCPDGGAELLSRGRPSSSLGRSRDREPAYRQ